MSRTSGWTRTAWASLAVTLGLLALVFPNHAARKWLIEWGWDEPDTAFLRANLREMEKAPFDGCVFSVRRGSGGRAGSFTWEFWGRRRFERAEVAQAFEDLRATRFRAFRASFLRVNVTPGDVDWFDDFSPIISNARLAAELARIGRARGVLLDVEQYQGQLFDYRRQRDVAARSWEEYATQARARGRAIMAALQDSYPDLTVFLTFGYTLPWVLADHGRRPLADTPYGLLAPFLDGLLDAARGRTRIVDGYELSYGFKEDGPFADARQLFAFDALVIVADPIRYRRHMRLGFGLWLDYDWRRQGWDALHPSRNYFTPFGFATALDAALRATDDYVWIYAETPRWWASSPPGATVPASYSDAIRRTREAPASRRPAD